MPPAADRRRIVLVDDDVLSSIGIFIHRRILIGSTTTAKQRERISRISRIAAYSCDDGWQNKLCWDLPAKVWRNEYYEAE